MKPDPNASASAAVWAEVPVWARVAFILGVPSLIAIGTVWNSETRLAANVVTNTAQIQEIRAAQKAHDDSTRQILDRSIENSKETVRLLRIICVTQQTTVPGRNACQGKE
jgi:hypothetical protein